MLQNFPRDILFGLLNLSRFAYFKRHYELCLRANSMPLDVTILIVIAGVVVVVYQFMLVEIGSKHEILDQMFDALQWNCFLSFMKENSSRCLHLKRQSHALQ